MFFHIVNCISLIYFSLYLTQYLVSCHYCHSHQERIAHQVESRIFVIFGLCRGFGHVGRQDCSCSFRTATKSRQALADVHSPTAVPKYSMTTAHILIDLISFQHQPIIQPATTAISSMHRPPFRHSLHDLTFQSRFGPSGLAVFGGGEKVGTVSKGVGDHITHERPRCIVQ